MSILFESSRIRGMGMRNRFVRSATWEGMASPDGACTPQLTELMTRLAKGGVGLMMTGHAYVRQNGRAGPRQLGIDRDERVGGLRDLTRSVHAEGGRIVVQLAHAGRHAATDLTGQPPLAPSQIEELSSFGSREMTPFDIQSVLEAFGQAALRAKEAGFDGLQIHAAHGYLLSQFLSPFYNRRSDAYGGSLENRARILREVVRSVRAAVGEDFPVLVKMNCQDFVERGLSLCESWQIGTMMEKDGVDAIELSGGTPHSGRLGTVRMKIDSEEKEAYFRHEARVFKEKIRIPLILVGGIRSFHLAERLVHEGHGDYIAMSRPFIREPALVARWQAGDLRKAACISCNRCFKPARAGEGVYCVAEKRERESHASR